MRRSHKLLVTSLVIGASVLLIAWNAGASTGKPAVGVADAKRDSALYVDRPISVRGAVVQGSIVMNGTMLDSFVLEDAGEQLRVLFGKPTPENFGPKDTVVNGVLERSADGSLTLRAESVMVGCSSKY